MPKNSFKYKVKLIPFTIKNMEQNIFKDKLNEIPYLLYEVEQLEGGNKIVINKPGGKRNFGRLSRNDFMVFVYASNEDELWLISHRELLADLEIKFAKDKNEALRFIRGLYAVCSGAEPDDVISNNKLKNSEGLPVETFYKAYKWIWGQEDCNYPKGKGRWLSMDEILVHFGLSKEDLEDNNG